MLQHAYDGSLWLFDLNSSHGTKVNHQPVQPQFFQQLLPGNSITFGRSKRHYVVRHGIAVGHSNRSNANSDPFMNMATSAIESGRAYQQPKATNHFSDLQAALRSAANVVKTRTRNV